MGILNIGTQALQANLIALQTAGNNIANVNTPGYSRQQVIQETVAGQFTGAGYIGKGVSVQTIKRSFDDFLTRQAALAGSISSADTTRATYLTQLGDIFSGGAEGLGAAINDMMNAFSDVASAPTDMTARTVLLTRVDEAARRMRTEPLSLDDIQNGVTQALKENISSINTTAKSIADVNQQIAKATGSGQPPNDLLDKRDQLIRDLNKMVQTSQVPADDGTVGIFIGGSQALVLGATSATVSLTNDTFGDILKNKLAITRNSTTTTIEDSSLGGGKVSGLLQFQNSDMVEARNLLGRITVAVTDAINNQHKLGLDLNGNVGGNLFTPVTFSAANVLVPVAPATLNTGANAVAGSLTLGIANSTKFAASDYDVNFTNATSGVIIRRSDGVATNFEFTPGDGVSTPGSFTFQTAADPVGGPYTGTLIDGLSLGANTTTNPAAGDRFLLKPFATAAGNVQREFSTPSALAVASPVAATLAPTNLGSLALSSILAKTQASTAAAPIPNYTVQFNVTGTGTTYDILDNTGAVIAGASGTYTTGTPISYTPAGQPGFEVTFTGAPANGDTVSIKQNAYASLSGGNATALMNLRDVPTFDGAALTDGYAGLIATVGIRSQSANYSATVSNNIAVNAEKNRTGLSGVNLDEEAAKLLQYQQAYQASAKMIQIAQNIFDTLIQGMGR
jgi:flagellar hook-associated protein 1 FlgK